MNEMIAEVGGGGREERMDMGGTGVQDVSRGTRGMQEALSRGIRVDNGGGRMQGRSFVSCYFVRS
ncbi:MAG: hypothetical protein JSW23_08320 [Planctomycetota bacterium]|nr:MAG: hypothetical protein JSW23_08320 [Planctomycetota bacterium]